MCYLCPWNEGKSQLVGWLLCIIKAYKRKPHTKRHTSPAVQRTELAQSADGGAEAQGDTVKSRPKVTGRERQT